MKYTAEVAGFHAEQFGSLKSARQWVRESYSRGMMRGESRRYSIALLDDEEFGDIEIEEGFVMNGRLRKSLGLHA